MTTYHRLTQQQLDEIKTLSIKEGIEKAHNDELKFLRKVVAKDSWFHDKPCSYLVCHRIEVLERE